MNKKDEGKRFKAGFDVGEVVRLKSGGLKMTVERTGAYEMFCCWFDLKGKLCRQSIPSGALEKVADDA